ncbi:MAG: ATP-dependent DNA helicase [Gammaproteobacteria bacterium]|nr:ATP-dependent DNA helicase [Gammaproteobacteria bacterium]
MQSREALSARGPLAQQIPGFVPRPSQQAMAQAVETALAEQRVFVAESGTGTGKTFAYLVPALLSGLKVMISTGTRNLQDQLFRRDLPLVRDALGIPVQAALLKGRSNYLCLHRLERTIAEGRFTARSSSAEFQRIQGWARRTKSGDIAEVGDVPEESELWPMVTSTVDNCLGSQCTEFNRCFVNRARREAATAEIIVINHHLFFADVSMREEGFAQLLPAADAVIFDEAHQLADIASDFFGASFSSHQLRNLCRDSIAEDIKEQSGLRELRPVAEAADRAVLDFRLALGTPLRRVPWADVAGTDEVVAALHVLQESLSELAQVLDAVAARGPGLANCARRATALLERLEQITRGDDLDQVAWVETAARSFMIRLTPLDVARSFQDRVRGIGTKAWIYTSATLAIGDDFTHFTARLGLDAQTARWTSPFNYEQQALLYIPRSLPEPSAPTFTAKVVEAALPVLRASRGRAFFLFTSHRALKIAAELLQGRLEHPLLVQGTMGRARLLDTFVAAGDAVLLGTGSFWEGVDVRGPALSCVIIDKFPFAAPDDPVLKARAAACAAAGGNPFMEYQLPEAVLSLKQGAGRLIRSLEDRGVLMLCDPRIYNRSYGKLFLESLPPMPQTRSLADVERFFETMTTVDGAA